MTDPTPSLSTSASPSASASASAQDADHNDSSNGIVPSTLDSQDIPSPLTPLPDPATLHKLLSETQPRGIQGLYHSSSVDCHLYAMFMFNNYFDYMLDKTDVNEEIARLLRETIINPLRTTHYVGAKKIVAFRLAVMKAIQGLTARSVVEENEPAQFLEWMQKMLRVSPFISLQSTIAIPSRDSGDVRNAPTDNCVEIKLKYKENTYYSIRQALEIALVQMKKRIAKIPDNLIISIKRDSGQFGELPPVIITTTIEVTDSLLCTKRLCNLCQKPVNTKMFECTDEGGCYGTDGHQLLNQVSFCEGCFTKAQHTQNCRRKPVIIQLNAPDTAPANVRMDLYAVLCKDLFGYTAYVKVPMPGATNEVTWVCFNPCENSTDDQGGYNTPKVKKIEKFAKYVRPDMVIEEDLSDKFEEDQKKLYYESAVAFYHKQ